MSVIVFGSSDDLKQYLRKNTLYTRAGNIFIGNLEFIDNESMHIVFTSRTSYEQWRDGEVQYRLF